MIPLLLGVALAAPLQGSAEVTAVPFRLEPGAAWVARCPDPRTWTLRDPSGQERAFVVDPHPAPSAWQTLDLPDPVSREDGTSQIMLSPALFPTRPLQLRVSAPGGQYLRPVEVWEGGRRVGQQTLRSDGEPATVLLPGGDRLVLRDGRSPPLRGLRAEVEWASFRLWIGEGEPGAWTVEACGPPLPPYDLQAEAARLTQGAAATVRPSDPVFETTRRPLDPKPEPLPAEPPLLTFGLVAAALALGLLALRVLLDPRTDPPTDRPSSGGAG